MPAGLQQRSPLPEPIFTPATKAPDGEHDINITEEQAANIVGKGIDVRLPYSGSAPDIGAYEYVPAPLNLHLVVR